MTLPERSSAAISRLYNLTRDMQSSPDGNSILAVQAEIMSLYHEVGLTLAVKFGGKEGAYIKRKVTEAKLYKKGRTDGKKTQADAINDARIEAGDEFDKELQAAEEYEMYRLLHSSLKHAFEHSRSSLSYIKTSESRS